MSNHNFIVTVETYSPAGPSASYPGANGPVHAWRPGVLGARLKYNGTIELMKKKL